jgi:tetratricopeptide (TPR) repeat protein
MSMSEMQTVYLSALSWLEAGRQEQVASLLETWRKEISSLQHSTDPASKANAWMLERMRRLLSIRLAMKNGMEVPNIENLLDAKSVADDFLKAEYLMALGLYCFNRGNYLDGYPHFELAETHFDLANRPDRALFAAYNRYIGLLNSGRITPEQESSCLLELEQKARRLNQEKALAWILRQKSYFLQGQAKPSGALAMIDEAIQLLIKQGPLSDLHLAYLQAADCLLDLKRPMDARARFEMIMGTVDSRVKFPIRYIEERLGASPGDLDPRDFGEVSPLWREKWQKHFSRSEEDVGSNSQVYRWSLKNGDLNIGQKTLPAVPPGTMEGRVLRLLTEQPRSKAYLCEVLWPEECENTALDNRLHRVISRLNKRVPGLIVLRDGVYLTSFPVNIERD